MPAQIPVTRTRVIVPRHRSDILTRQRLLDSLFSLVDKKLTLIAAPAGYGKTSLLIDFANQIELPVCWYAINPMDRDVQRFAAHFISSIAVRFPGFGRSSLDALQNTSQDQLDLDNLVTTIINDAYENISEHFVVVLDDYHLVDSSKTVSHFVNRFVQDIDENCHLIVASRTLLTLPDLPLMVARSQVDGLSFAELAFRSDEIQELFQHNYQLAVSDEEALELIQRTEGWITGILLTTQTIGGETTEGWRQSRISGAGINEYFERILSSQPPNIQDFLLRSSLLEEFDADLCEEVIRNALNLHKQNWTAIMDTVMRSNLFVLPVGDEGIWLRYHHLFRDFLQNRIEKERPDETRLILNRIAEVFAARGDWERAYFVYQRLGETGATVELVEKGGPSMLAGGRLATLSEWLDSLPPNLFSHRPALLSLEGGVASLRGKTRQGLQLYNQAIQAMTLPQDREILIRTLVRRAATYRMVGDFKSSMEDGYKALELIGEDLDLRSVQAEAQRSIGGSLFQQGRFSEAQKWMHLSLRSYTSLRDRQMQSVLQLEIGMVYQALGSYSEAEQIYRTALEYWRETRSSLWQANLLNNLGFLQYLIGDYEEAASTLEKALEHARLSGYLRMEAFALTSLGDLYRDLGADTEALDAYHQARQIAEQINERTLIHFLVIAEATLSAQQGDYDNACMLLDKAQTNAVNAGLDNEINLIRIEMSMVNLNQGKPADARTELASAAAYFENEGQRIETARSYFCMAIASYETGDAQGSEAQLEQAFAQLTDQNSRNTLIPTALRIKNRVDAAAAGLNLNSKLGEFVREIHRFERRLPTLRKHLRQRASIMSFTLPKMTIRTLGRMQVRIKDHTITSSDWQTQTARDLFFLLLAHPEGLTKEEIGMIFWPDSSDSELKFRFKNTIYRVRHALAKEVIVLQDEYYRFNRTLDYEYDVEQLTHAIAQAENSADDKQKIEHYQTVLKLYKGIYLPGAEETWVVSEREWLMQTYVDTLLKLASLNFKNEQHTAALEHCQRALTEDICLEAAHRLTMQIHAAMGNRAAVSRQYERCRQVLQDEIGAEPSAQTKDLYTALMR